MKIKKVKDEIRAIGIDDAPFIPHTEGTTRVFGVITRGNNRIEGIEQTNIEIDGVDATKKIGQMILKSNHCDQIRVILLNGITYGGFNVCDVDELEKITNKPVITVIEHKPNMESIKAALEKNQIDWETKWNIFEKAHIQEIIMKKDVKPLYVHYSDGLTLDIVKKILEKTIQISHIPECIRIAHLIGASFIK